MQPFATYLALARSCLPWRVDLFIHAAHKQALSAQCDSSTSKEVCVSERCSSYHWHTISIFSFNSLSLDEDRRAQFSLFKKRLRNVCSEAGSDLSCDWGGHKNKAALWDQSPARGTVSKWFSSDPAHLAAVCANGQRPPLTAPAIQADPWHKSGTHFSCHNLANQKSRPAGHSPRTHS